MLILFDHRTPAGIARALTLHTIFLARSLMWSAPLRREFTPTLRFPLDDWRRLNVGHACCVETIPSACAKRLMPKGLMPKSLMPKGLMNDD
jgi:hypothetical protein